MILGKNKECSFSLRLMTKSCRIVGVYALSDMSLKKKRRVILGKNKECSFYLRLMTKSCRIVGVYALSDIK